MLDLPDFTHVVLRDIARDGRALIEIGQDYRFIAALVSGASAEVDLSWQVYSQLRDLSLDGRMVLFAGMGETPGREEAYVRKTDGSPAIHLGSGSPFALSPDGAWALVGPPEGSESSLTLVPTGAGERKVLSRGTIEHYAQVYFFSDGRRIAMLAREPGHAMRVWIQDVAGGEPRPISDEGIRHLVRPALDGDVVPACLDEESCALYPVAGGQSRPLPRVRGLPLQLTPDGKSVIVGRGGVQLRHLSRDPAALWVVDLATGSDRLLRRLESSTHVTLMYTLRLTPDASGYAYTHVFSSYDVFLVEGLK